MKKGLWGLCHVLLVMALTIMVNASAVEAAYHHDVKVDPSDSTFHEWHRGVDYLEGRQYRITNVYPQDGIQGRPQPYLWVLPEEVGSVVEGRWSGDGAGPLTDGAWIFGQTPIVHGPEICLVLVSAPANTRFAQNLEWHQAPENWRSVGDVLIDLISAKDGYGNPGPYASLKYIEVPEDIFLQAKPEDFVLTPVEFSIDKPMSEWTEEDLARIDAENYERLYASNGDSTNDSSVRTAIVDGANPISVKLVESGNTITVCWVGASSGYGSMENPRPIFTMERIK